MAFGRDRHLLPMSVCLRSTVIVLLAVLTVNGREVTIPNLGMVNGIVVDFVEVKFINVDMEIDAFLGIPFAQSPPVRFSPPEPVAPWSGVWNATYFRPPCGQLSAKYKSWSEDCLYLNVFVPSPMPRNASVIVWIHGGGFSTGTGSTYAAYGAPLVAVGKDVIVVTINYRLMVWSVFNTADDVARGNYGLLDQQLALQWVQDNIRAFGGDPSRVTLFGESAGAASVDFHFLSQGSHGLFSQGILQSGSAFAPWAFRDDPEADRREALALGSRVGCNQTDSQMLVDCLRQVDALTMMEAFWQVYLRSFMRVDGVFLMDTPANLVASGSFKRAPLIAGFNSDEGKVLTKGMFRDHQGDVAPVMSRSMYDENISRFISGYVDDLVRASVDQEYVDWTQVGNASADYLEAFAGAVGDQRFMCPTYRALRSHAELGDVAFQYYMTHAPSTSYFQVGQNGTGPSWPGASHTEDIQFVFGWPFIPEFMADRRALHDDEIELSVKVMTMWTNFARFSHPGKMDATSEPATSGDFYWPQYTVQELGYKELALDLPTGIAIRARKCAFWNQYLPRLIDAIQSVRVDEQKWREGFTSWQDDMAEWRNVFNEYKQTFHCNH